MRRRERALRVAAVLAVPAAVGLALLAFEAFRLPREIAADDVRFQAAPRLPRTLWDDLGYLPGSPAARLLGATDDVRSRQTVALFAQVDPAKVPINSPAREALRGRAQLEVTIQSRENGGDPRRRAQHLNLLGILTMSRFSNFGGEANLILARGIGAFQSAIEADPQNPDAKRNLEILLRRPEAVHLPPTAPVQGGAQGRVSGQGRAGGGY